MLLQFSSESVPVPLHEACPERNAWLRKTDLPYGMGKSMLRKKKEHACEPDRLFFFLYAPLNILHCAHDRLFEML